MASGRWPADCFASAARGFVLFLLAAAPAVAEPVRPGFGVPLDCRPNLDCFVQNLFDHDAGPGTRDYQCGRLTYNGHTGTDIRVPHLADMSRGVAVLAAADGQVRAIRDGMDDVNVRETGQESIRHREAGNSVLIDHGGGWITLYAHMRKGSVAVVPGARVRKGQKLGLLGLSGNTEFPHLHFEVRHKGKAADPFSDTGSNCMPANSLWLPDALATLRYVPTGILGGGFLDHAPTQKEILRGDAAPASADAAALVFWVNLFGMQAGDEETMTLYTPDGAIAARATRAVDRDKAQWLTYIGLKRRAAKWPQGIYRGTYQLKRTSGQESREVLNWATTITLPSSP